MWLIGALMLALTQSPDIEAQGPVDEADLAAAWSSGDMRLAAPVFLNAFHAVSHSECAISPYAAQLAYRTGMLDWSGYHFSMALLIDERVGGLSEVQREVAREMRSQPGEHQAEDQFYLFSPYLDPDLNVGACPDLEFPDLPLTAAGQGMRAVVIVRANVNGTIANQEIEEAILLDSYPPSEGEELAASLIGLKRAYADEFGWSVQSFNFTPCYQYTRERTTYRICRPGFIREPSSAD